MTTISWLHISDWHQRGTDFDRMVVRDRLLDDLTGRTDIAPELATIRLVIFSGDLAFAGLQSEYEAARTHLLEPIRERLDLKPSDFFLVPGNHDIDRGHVTKFAPQILRKPFETEREMQEWLNGDRERGYILEPFTAFNTFATSYGSQASPSFASIKTIDADKKTVAILGLNSALMCGRRLDPKGEVDDYGVLTLGEPQIHQPLNTIGSADLRIVVLHHPFEWFFEYDRMRVETALYAKSDLILSGHVHRPGITVGQRPGGSTVLIPAGSSYDRRNPTNPGYANSYNFVSIDLAKGKGTIYLRRWDDQNARWGPDHATSPNGRHNFQVPLLIRAAKRSRSISTPIFQPAEREAAVVAEYRRRLLESCDVLELANLPSDHIVAQRELKLRQLFIPTRVVVEPGIPDGKSDRDELEARLAIWETERNERVLRRGGIKSAREEGPLANLRVAPGSCLERGPRLMLLGDPGSGKTTFTRWFAMACLLRLENNPAAQGMIDLGSLPAEPLEPVLIRCRDLERGEERRSILSLLHRCYRADALSEMDNQALARYFEAAIRAGRALLILDGLDEIADATRRNAFCDKVLELARDFPALRMIATSRIVGYRETGGRLRNEFLHARVDDLSRAEKDRFVTDWCDLTEAPERRAQSAADLIRDIHGNDRIGRLTSSPILLTTMALVRRNIGRLPQRRVELYPKTIEVLMYWRSAVDPPMVEREAMPQLAHLAYEMCALGVPRLDEPAVLANFQTMRKEFPYLEDIRQQAPATFLRQVEARTALLIQAGHERLAGQTVPVYEFRHLSFQEYLAAWAIVHGFEPGFEVGRRLPALIGNLAERVVAGSRENETSESASMWTEVVRLCIADCRHEEVDPCLRQILGTGEDELRAALAGFCLADEPPNVAPETINGILNALCRVRPSSLERYAGDTALRALESLGGTRWSEATLELLLKSYAEAPDDGSWYAAAADRIMHASNTASTAGLTSNHWIKMLDEASEAISFGAMFSLTRRINPYFYVGGQYPHFSPDFAQVDRPAFMAALINRLRGSPGIRRAAATTLGRLGDPSAVPNLQESLRDDDRNVRRSAITALGRLGDAVAVPDLQQCLHDDDSDVRKAAAAALGSLGDAAAVPDLRESLRDTDDDVREAAAAALGSLGDTAAAPDLRECLRDDDSDVRKAAAAALGKLGDAAAVPDLLQCLRDSDSSVREAAAAALGSLGDTAAAADLRECLRDDDSNVRTVAATAIGIFGDLAAAPCLRQCLRDGDWAVRQASALALGSVGEVAAVPDLTRCLFEDEDSDVRQAAAVALGQLGDTVAGADLRRCLFEDEDSDVRQAAALALGRIGDAAAADLRRCLDTEDDGDVRQAVTAALGHLGDAATLTQLRKDLRDKDGGPRLFSAALLDILGDPEGAATFQAALVDPDQEVRDAALRAFAHAFGEPEGRLLTRDGDGLEPFLLFGDCLTRPQIRDLAGTVGVTEAAAMAFYSRVAPRFGLRLPC